jgi:hypothetical protein
LGLIFRECERDRVVWKEEHLGLYMENSAYRILQRDIVGGGEVINQNIWLSLVPLKVIVFL